MFIAAPPFQPQYQKHSISSTTGALLVQSPTTHHFDQKPIKPYMLIFKRFIQPCALRALGLLLADGAPTVGRGKTF